MRLPGAGSDRRRGAHGTEHELLETLAGPVCAVCQRTTLTSDAYLAGVLREGINDVAVRTAWRRRGGLCSRHWRAFRAQESPPLAAAILTEDLLTSYLTAQGRPEIACPACEIEAHAERRYLAGVAGLGAEPLAAALAAGSGFVCLRHLEALPSGDVRDIFEGRLRQLLDELATFRRRQDYRFAGEPAGAERDSWLRAIRVLGGDV